MIEVKFVEITQEDSKALGFDWYLGGVPMGGATNVNLPGSAGAPTGGVFPGAGAPSAGPATPPATGQAATVTELLSDPQFRSV
jgi:type II secretory pathway component GspD/PulD (secretin)